MKSQRRKVARAARRFGHLVMVVALLAGGEGFAENPIIQTKYTAAPAPLVYGDTLYLYTAHDEDDAVGFKNFNWLLYSTTDMANWTDHGIVAGVVDPTKTFTWASGTEAWSAQCVEKGGKLYLYATARQSSGTMVIGVAVADSPYGPFVDPIGVPLISSGSGDIDPTVFIDSDGKGYLYWGNSRAYYVTLNPDMTSYSGEVMEATRFSIYQEAPWLYKHANDYYLAFASTCCPEAIGYAMGAAPTGPWAYTGSIMDGNPQSSTNHPGIVDYKGNSYVFSHNYALQVQREGSRVGERRSVTVDKMTYDLDGKISKLPTWSTTGPEQIGHLDPYVRTEAETLAWAWDVKTEACDEGGMDVTAIENGDHIKVRGVDFGAGAESLDVRVASATGGGTIEVRLDDLTGTRVAVCSVPDTGDFRTWTTSTCAVSGASGVHDLVFLFTGGSGSLFNFNWWKFTRASIPVDAGQDANLATDASSGTAGAGGSGSGGVSGNGGTSGISSTGGIVGGLSGTGGGMGTGGITSTGGTVDTGGVGGTIERDAAVGSEDAASTGGAGDVPGATATGGVTGSVDAALPTAGEVDTGGTIGGGRDGDGSVEPRDGLGPSVPSSGDASVGPSRADAGASDAKGSVDSAYDGAPASSPRTDVPSARSDAGGLDAAPARVGRHGLYGCSFGTYGPSRLSILIGLALLLLRRRSKA